VACPIRRASQSLHDESGHCAAGLDAEKKDAGVLGERKEEEREQWQFGSKSLDARRFVFIE
jgi:hypothetical protein